MLRIIGFMDVARNRKKIGNSETCRFYLNSDFMDKHIG
jgi:hypothetical protein